MFRTKPENPVQKVCYFNTSSNDQLLYVFVSKRINFDSLTIDRSGFNVNGT